MNSLTHWQKAITYSAWLASFVAVPLLFYQQQQEYRAWDRAFTDTQAKASQRKPVTPPETQYVPGLFGKVEASSAKTEEIKAEKKAVRFALKSLEGVFINNQQAYALVTDYNGQTQVIPPESISAYTRNSVTVQLAQEVKSLYIRQDETGLEVKRINQHSPASAGEEIQKISEADKIRLQLLNK